MSLITRIYGRDRMHSTCYLTRVKLTPKTRWGQLYLHVFHRLDQDRDPHDHPYDFWTFPLVTYTEEVLEDGVVRKNRVRAFRWHFRPAEYTHRMLGGPDGKAITFIWRKQTRRMWGFWVNGLYWVPWREYLFN